MFLSLSDPECASNTLNIRPVNGPPTRRAPIDAKAPREAGTTGWRVPRRGRH